MATPSIAKTTRASSFQRSHAIRPQQGSHSQASSRFSRRCTAPCQAHQRIQSSSTLTATPTASVSSRGFGRRSARRRHRIAPGRGPTSSGRAAPSLQDSPGANLNEARERPDQRSLSRSPKGAPGGRPDRGRSGNRPGQDVTQRESQHQATSARRPPPKSQRPAIAWWSQFRVTTRSQIRLTLSVSDRATQTLTVSRETFASGIRTGRRR